jgi:hypothetical protein
MAKKLCVALRDGEYREIERIALARQISVADWVRQAIEVARWEEGSGEVERKLSAIRAAARHELPTGDIDTMLAEIERGYISSVEGE